MISTACSKAVDFCARRRFVL